MRRFVSLIVLVSTACAPVSATAPSTPRAPEAEPRPAPTVTLEPAAPPAEPPPIAAASEPPRVEGCRCPAGTDAAPQDGGAAAPEDHEDDPEFRARRARARMKVAAALAARLKRELPQHKPACDVVGSGPCSLRGDFNGDGARDEVALVRDGAGAGGLAFLWAGGGVELLGGGRRGVCWTATEVPDLDGTAAPASCPEEIDADLDWLAGWALRPREVGSEGPAFVGRVLHRMMRFKAADSVGDGVLLDGGDAAAILYWRREGWVLMDLGY